MSHGEFEIIKDYFAPIAKKNEDSLGLEDDAAFIPNPKSGKRLVVTKDAIVEGYHYLKTDSPASVAKKLLRVSVSDIAAMGAKPTSCVIASFYSPNISSQWLKQFSDALAEDLEKYSMYLLGGDTVKSPDKTMFSLTAFGEVAEEDVLKRSGAEIDDIICVSGTIGDAALGLKVLQKELRKLSKEDKDFLIDKYHYPIPRPDLGVLLPQISKCAMDISDGLCADLSHICDASNVSAEIYIKDIPLSKAVKNAVDFDKKYYNSVLAGGDDYQLLFTVKPENQSLIEQISKKADCKIAKIGKIVEKNCDKVVAYNSENEKFSIEKMGYAHF